ncbi:MAG: hypothetical protein ACK5NG_07205 [Chthoniobacterales bacterium]
MKDASIALLLILLIAGALILQEFFQPMAAYGGAQILFVPMLIVYACLRLPFPWMLLIAFLGGWSSDLMSVHLIDGKAELAVGTSIFFFLIIGCICQGLRVLFLRGYWWLFSLMSGLSTSLLLALQFFLISFRRFESGGLDWNYAVTLRILIPGLIALLIAPLFQSCGFFLERLIFREKESRRSYQ